MTAWVHRALARAAALVRRDRIDDELAADVASHIEMLTDEYIAGGMEAGEARRQARLRFGSVDAAMELHRDVRSFRWIESTFQDLRYAARLLRRQPGLTAAVVLTLGIGIGAPVAAFGLLNGFVFGTPQSADPDAFFRIVRTGRFGTGAATVAEYETLRAHVQSAREIAAWSHIRTDAPMGTEDPARVLGLFTSCNLFRVLGVEKPVAGRLLSEADCAAGAPVAVISERLWQQRFAADPAVVGSAQRYGGTVTIVGVAAAPPIQREALDPDPDFSPDIWIPYTAQPSLKAASEFLVELMHHRDHRWLEVVGLLAPGVPRKTAEAEFRTIEANAAPRRDGPWSTALTGGSRWEATPWMMLGAIAMALALPALVMLTACVNVAALLLPRAVIRQREMAVRLTLGTSKARLVRMLLMESLLLSALAAGVSLVLVYTIPPMLVRFFDLEIAFGPADLMRPDWRVFGCLALAGILAAVASGLTPALESLNPRLAETLKGPRTFVFKRSAVRSRRLFVAIQIAASMVLLVTAFAFSRSAVRATAPGFTAKGVLVATLREEGKAGVPLSSLAESAATVPGVRAVAYADYPPLIIEASMGTTIPGHAEPAWPLISTISPDYFAALEIPILVGRALEIKDYATLGEFNPIVVSNQFARRFFAGRSPLGQELQGTVNGGTKRLTIVGVAGDREVGRSRTQPALTDGSIMYQLMPLKSREGHLLVKTDGDAGAIAASVGATLREATGSAKAVQTLESRLAVRVDGARRIRAVLLTMGAVSLLLAIIGVLGTVSADATQRRKEFAIRSALGATPWAVRRCVIRAGMRPLPAALGFGVLASWGVLKTGEGLYPIASLAGDVAPYAVTVVLLLAVAITTLLTVAYPASRRDPVMALRED